MAYRMLTTCRLSGHYFAVCSEPFNPLDRRAFQYAIREGAEEISRQLHKLGGLAFMSPGGYVHGPDELELPHVGCKIEVIPNTESWNKLAPDRATIRYDLVSTP